MRLVAVLATALLVAAPAAAEPSPLDDQAGDAVAAASAPAAEAASRISAVEELERLVLAEINRVRREQGLSQLTLSRSLAATAREHSLSMAQDGFFRHDSYDGTPFWRRVKARYAPTRNGYWGVGENMAWGSPGLSAAQTVEMWLKSPPHRKNLLTPMWRQVGIGGIHALAAPGVYGGLDVTIVTADFGVRR